MKRFENKIAVITGATSGIGFEIALKFISQGLKVYLIGRSFEKLNTSLIENRNKERIIYIKANLDNDKDLNEIVSKIKSEETIDILVHSAAVISLGRFENDSIDNLDKQYRINVRACYFITQKLLPKIIKSKGDIVFINSTAGLDSWETIGQYAASKHALKALADSLRLEIKEKKVRVTNLFLGSVDTPMQKNIQKIKGNKYNPNSFLNSKEIANIMSFILSLENRITVTDITIRPN